MIINLFGVVPGLIGLFIFQMIASFTFLSIYDQIGGDVLQISTIAGVVSRIWHWVKRKLIVDRPLISIRLSNVIKFIIFSWQLLPPFVVLLWRENGVKGKPRKEMLMMLASTTIATLWWSLYSMVIIKVWHKLSP
ncbi:MAG: hypothetical protein WC237_03040 [Candidatus Paceibacterota bacterium]